MGAENQEIRDIAAYLAQTSGGELEHYLPEAVTMVASAKAKNAEAAALREGATSDEAAAIAAATALGSDWPSDTDMLEVAAKLGGSAEGRRVTFPGPGNQQISIIFSKLLRDADQKMIVADFFVYGPGSAAKKYVHQKLGTTGRHPLIDAAMKARAAMTWRQTLPAPGTPVEEYLRSRALILPVPPALRFHQRLFYSEGKTHRHWPAMISQRSDVDGNIVGVHRTWLQHDGRGKAPYGSDAKKDLGSTSGTAIRLSPVADELMIGEGIETTLSAMQVSGKPGWAAGNTGVLCNMILPIQIKSIIILADRDEPGEAAARFARQRWLAEGRRVRIARPPGDHNDFNDALMANARRSAP